MDNVNYDLEIEKQNHPENFIDNISIEEEKDEMIKQDIFVISFLMKKYNLPASASQAIAESYQQGLIEGPELMRIVLNKCLNRI